MHAFDFLDEIALLCLAALVVLRVFRQINLPPVIGLIVTGLLLGPTGFGIVEQDQIISSIAEIGVMLLLFTIGLEFSLDELKKLRSIVLIGGPLQIILTTLATTALVYGVSMIASTAYTASEAILIGMASALSSTAICIKLLSERRELSQPQGRAAVGILIFQDIAVVPMMIAVTLLDTRQEVNPGEITVRLLLLVVVTVAMIIGMRLILPRLTPHLTRSSNPEVLILAALGLCFGAAWVTSLAGISMALGAFIAGMAIAGSDDGHAIGKAVEPLRDAFTSMFFLSVGLLVHVVWATLPANIITAVLILLVKGLVVSLVLILIRVPIRTAITAGITLAQVGEFSFVLASVGMDYGVISSTEFQNLLVTIIITMIVTPLLVTFAPIVAERVSPLARFAPNLRRWTTDQNDGYLRLDASASVTEQPMVLIIGAGVLGLNVAHVLAQTGIRYRLLELDRNNAAALRARGEPVISGDMTDIDVLRNGGIEHVSNVIIAINQDAAIASGVKLIRALRPDVNIIVRSRYQRNSKSALDQGADLVIVEEFESGIKILGSVLENLGVEQDLIDYQERYMRLRQTFS
ncbi:MAG: sodium:proton exchanger [Candidatus Kapabacteria bacterium]|nr:sodium:proton exchanger [Candidatus Kapabacteria bacterium]